jgi:hypothetical protein
VRAEPRTPAIRYTVMTHEPGQGEDEEITISYLSLRPRPSGPGLTLASRRPTRRGGLRRYGVRERRERRVTSSISSPCRGGSPPARPLRRSATPRLITHHLRGLAGAAAVAELTSRFGTLVRKVQWSPDRSQVRLEGSGVWIELRLDGQAVHMSADLPLLGRFLGGSVSTRLQEILQPTFQQKLPGDKGKA